MAQIGDRVSGRATVRRVGRRLALTACEFHAAERLVLPASAMFATGRNPAVSTIARISARERSWAGLDAPA